MLLRTPTDDPETHIDFVPMVDVLFNLLIFFLLATSMVQAQREMKVALPQTVAAGPMSAALREIVVTVDAAGNLDIGGRGGTLADLASAVRSAVAANPDQKVCIRGDRAAPYASIAAVLDTCKGAGVDQPYLESVPLR
jgi:biopolymer transport protein ExbD